MIEIIAALAGVALGFILAVIWDLFKSNQGKKVKRQQLSILVCHRLDSFFSQAVDVVLHENGSPLMQADVIYPKLVFDDLDVEWTTLNSDLMERLLNLPVVISQTIMAVDFAFMVEGQPYSPDTDRFWKKSYAELAADAESLSRKLKEQAKLDGIPKIRGGWNPFSRLLVEIRRQSLDVSEAHIALLESFEGNTNES